MLEEHYKDADVIIGQRVCNNPPSQTWQRLAAEGRKLVFEVDDDLFHVDPSNTVAYGFFSQRQVQDNLAKNAEVASMVTVTTEPLAAVMREFNGNVVVIPNYIDEDIFNIAEPKSPHLTVGWAGSTSHQMDFDEVKGILKSVARKNPDVHFQFSGADYGRKIFPPQRYTFLPYEQEVWEHWRLVARLNIGIAPLRAHVFNAGKSAVKAVEFMSLGLPGVYSHVRAYEDAVEHGVTGFLARNDQDWSKYLGILINEPDTALAMATAALERARGWTIQANAHKWETALRSIVEADALATA